MNIEEDKHDIQKEDEQDISVVMDDCTADFLCKDKETGICIYITGDIEKIFDIDNIVINFKNKED